MNLFNYTLVDYGHLDVMILAKALMLGCAMGLVVLLAFGLVDWFVKRRNK